MKTKAAPKRRRARPISATKIRLVIFKRKSAGVAGSSNLLIKSAQFELIYMNTGYRRILVQNQKSP